MLVGGQRQHVTVQRQRVQALQYVVEDVRLVDRRQLGQQLVDVLQRLRQTVQVVLEAADGRLPEAAFGQAIRIGAVIAAIVRAQVVGQQRAAVAGTAAAIVAEVRGAVAGLVVGGGTEQLRVGRHLHGGGGWKFEMAFKN